MSFFDGEIACPYCGKIGKVSMNKAGERIFYDCFAEMGGCGKVFVVQLNAEIAIITRRIEGEDVKEE